MCRPEKNDPRFGPGVRLEITRILGPNERKWDVDSIGRGSAKAIIDALVFVGWFPDDRASVLAGVDWQQDDTRRQMGPAVEVVLFEGG